MSRKTKISRHMTGNPHTNHDLPKIEVCWCKSAITAVLRVEETTGNCAGDSSITAVAKSSLQSLPGGEKSSYKLFFKEPLDSRQDLAETHSPKLGDTKNCAALLEQKTKPWWSWVLSLPSAIPESKVFHSQVETPLWFPIYPSKWELTLWNLETPSTIRPVCWEKEGVLC